MCGICGTAAPALPPGREQAVRTMMGRLRHRGPDGEGLASGPGFAFGHTRLAVIDREGGRQPMTTGDGRFTLVFNGEIYNYVELRRELAAAGVRFSTRSDTEVLLELLAAEGERGLHRLNGMFAFALHDGTTGSVLLARDHFGVKPLYYTLTAEGELVFASEVKALLVHPQVAATRSDRGLHQYLTFQFCLGDETLFAGIHSVEPGCLIRWAPHRGVQAVRYWTMDFTVDTDHTPSYFAHRLDDLLRDSVRLQLRSDVPVGTYLSGGVDSSVITVLASDLAPGPLSSFHGRFEEGRHYDESAYARLVADQAGVAYHEVVPTERDFIEDLPRLVYHMDHPAAGPGLFPQYRVCRLAAEHVKVVLGGQGGDELFGGYARYLIAYVEQALKGAIFETQEEGQHVVTLASVIPNLAVLREYAPLIRSFWAEGVFGPMEERYFRLIDRAGGMEQLLCEGVMDDSDRAKVFEAFNDEFSRSDTLSYINKMTHFDLKTLLPALLQVEDRVSMAVSLESRVPLLDARIAQLVMSMPPALKFGGGRTKSALRDAARRLLPGAVVERKDKMGFPVPLTEWLRRGPVRDFCHDVLLDRRARDRGLFCPEGVERLMEAEAPFGRQLWGALCLELWHRCFIDGS